MPKLTDGMQGGPVVVFDPHGNTLVVSPFSQFMAASMTYVNNTLSWGIMGEVDSVPNMYSVQTIMYYSSEGINRVSTKYFISASTTCREWEGSMMVRMFVFQAGNPDLNLVWSAFL